jgi:hypothetical protein
VEGNSKYNFNYLQSDENHQLLTKRAILPAKGATISIDASELPSQPKNTNASLTLSEIECGPGLNTINRQQMPR